MSNREEYDDLLDDGLDEDTAFEDDESDYDAESGGLFRGSSENSGDEEDYPNDYGQVDTKSMKKKFLIVILVGIFIIGIAFWIYPKVLNKKPKQEPQQDQQITQEQGLPQENQQVQQNLPAMNVEPKLQPLQNQKTLQTVPAGQIESSSLSDLEQRTRDKEKPATLKEIQQIGNINLIAEDQLGILTVSAVRFYIRSKEIEEQSIQYKCLLTGNISGLIGTFDVEIPVQYASSIQKGMQLKVSYNVYEHQGQTTVKLVNDIKVLEN